MRPPLPVQGDGTEATQAHGLDDIAAQAVDHEPLASALQALAPDMSEEAMDALAVFFQSQGATNRSEILAVVRVRGGKFVMSRAMARPRAFRT